MKNSTKRFFVLSPLLLAMTAVAAYFPSGPIISINDSFTRPADTSAYLANDAIAAVTNYSALTAMRSLGVGRVAGGCGYITGLRVWTQQTNVTARIRVHLYSVAQPTNSVAGDNYPMTISYLNAWQRLQHVDLPAMQSGVYGGDASLTSDMTVRLPFKCDAGMTNIYYRLETLDAFTPTSAAGWFISVWADQR